VEPVVVREKSSLLLSTRVFSCRLYARDYSAMIRLEEAGKGTKKADVSFSKTSDTESVSSSFSRA
jgi:hypothetical protein